ncbi:MAG: ribose-5-phosphate isomerase RpiA [Treponema sp.]|jgi:ribose 5-phosphate isomerase A|nr:ribose-5-phosphate isomerase RpiA [Treponema sp.]
MLDQQGMKALAGKRAVETLVSSGMKLGLGTGSTAIPAVEHIGALLAAGKLRGILAVPTSFQTSMVCEQWGIPLYTLNSKEINGSLDLTIDGADQVDLRNYCTKGGGGALLLEKIIAHASSAYAVVVDESKLAGDLAVTVPLPVEVVSEARIPVTRALEALGAEVILREAVRKAGPVITEHGNLLLDIRFKQPPDSAALEAELNGIPGIVENGLFTRLRPKVFIARRDGTVEIRD